MPARAEVAGANGRYAFGRGHPPDASAGSGHSTKPTERAADPFQSRAGGWVGDHGSDQGGRTRVQQARHQAPLFFTIGQGWVDLVGPYERDDTAAVAHLCGAAAGLCDHGATWASARGTPRLCYRRLCAGRHRCRRDVHGRTIYAAGNIHRLTSAQCLDRPRSRSI